jgi:hypothetical protein
MNEKIKLIHIFQEKLPLSASHGESKKNLVSSPTQKFQ